MANLFAMVLAIMIVMAASANATDLATARHQTGWLPIKTGHIRHFGVSPHATKRHETKKQFKKDVARDPDVGKPSEFVK